MQGARHHRKQDHVEFDFPVPRQRHDAALERHRRVGAREEDADDELVAEERRGEEEAPAHESTSKSGARRSARPC